MGPFGPFPVDKKFSLPGAQCGWNLHHLGIPDPPLPDCPSPQVWDLRKDDEPAMVLKGHADTLTGMRVSPDGSHLLTNAMDGTLRVWDMRPYAPQNRCVKVFNGEALSLIGTQRKRAFSWQHDNLCQLDLHC